jgi:hypothetical protein
MYDPTDQPRDPDRRRDPEYLPFHDEDEDVPRDEQE